LGGQDIVGKLFARSEKDSKPLNPDLNQNSSKQNSQSNKWREAATNQERSVVRRNWLGWVATSFAALAALAMIWFYTQLERPVTPKKGGVIVEIPKGAGAKEIGQTLAQEGVIASAWTFWAARGLRGGKALQAGDYLFDKPLTPLEVFDRIAAGKVMRYQVQVPEGANMFDVARIVEKAGLASSREFLQVAQSSDLVQDFAPRARSLEGYLYPETYFFSKNSSAKTIAKEMVRQFRKQWNSMEVPGDPHDLVTLASLVEKESAVAAERPVVAGVYQNRLKKGMRLECDPTTIYAALLEGRWRGKIYRSDLDLEHPYNTYRSKGLPPGPIANPGIASLRAAASPADTEFLFFVAKGDGSGGHNFSASQQQHVAAVREYRRRTR
jgi:UPF0755 protein